MKNVLMRVGLVACVSLLFGCGGVGFSPIQPQVARTIPADMEVVTCQGIDGNNAIVVQVSIPASESVDWSLKNGIRDAAAEFGQKQCPHQRGAIAVILNHGEQSRRASITYDGVNWTEVAVRRVSQQGGAVQLPKMETSPVPQRQQQLPGQVITRSIEGFALGMPLDHAIALLVDGVQKKRFQPLDSAEVWHKIFDTRDSINPFKRDKAQRGLITTIHHPVGSAYVQTSSLASFAATEAQKIVLRFYEDKLYEIAVWFRIDSSVLQDALGRKYGQPAVVNYFNAPPRAFVWEDPFTLLTMHTGVYAQEGVWYQDKQILDMIRLQTRSGLPKNY